jgi:chemotaxis protein MotA
VFAAVLAGFVLEEGNLWVLFQPAELLIVGGAAVGIVLVANPPSTIVTTIRAAAGVFRRREYSRGQYIELLRMLYELFAFTRRFGVQAMETEAERPESGQVLKHYPRLMGDRTALAFICESLRLMAAGGTTPEELDRLMELDIGIQHQARHKAVSALSLVADSLPGLGIVAAVLGVVVTMQAIGGSPETVGQKVAAALVGTFVGILLCYGVFGPLAAHLEQRNEAQSQFLDVLRVALLAHARGTSPLLATEYARRSIAPDDRPSFAEMEKMIRTQVRVATAPVEVSAAAAAEKA